MAADDGARLIPAARHALGVITPSGNTVVEQVTIAILRSFPEISCHFSRTTVTGEIDPFPASYDWESMLNAARLLSHAKPGLLTWSGSKAGSIGFGLDRDLCRRVKDQTGLACSTSTLALIEVLLERGGRRLGLVSPYALGYQKKIVDTFAREGFPIIAEACSGISDNLAYASVGADEIRRMTLDVAAARPDAIIAWCTNMMSAPLAAELEAETGIPFYDSTALAVWHPLKVLGLNIERGKAWGSLFSGTI